MSKDFKNNFAPAKSLHQSCTATTNGAIVDLLGYDTKGLLVITDSVVCDGSNKWTLKFEHGDVATLTDAATVGDAYLDGTLTATATQAYGTLTFTGTTADGETVTIGGRVYEFDTNGSITAGRVSVDISGGNSASQSVTALVAAINADASAVVTAADGAGDTVVVTAITTDATTGNAIGSTKTVSNATWGDTTLDGGIDALAIASSSGLFAINASIPTGGIVADLSYTGNKRYLRAVMTKAASAPNIVASISVVRGGAASLPI
jgi:hypothetical protein